MWDLPRPGLEPCPLHWQADSQPLRHQVSPRFSLFLKRRQCDCHQGYNVIGKSSHSSYRSPELPHHHRWCVNQTHTSVWPVIPGQPHYYKQLIDKKWVFLVNHAGRCWWGLFLQQCGRDHLHSSFNVSASVKGLGHQTSHPSLSRSLKKSSCFVDFQIPFLPHPL